MIQQLIRHNIKQSWSSSIMRYFCHHTLKWRIISLQTLKIIKIHIERYVRWVGFLESFFVRRSNRLKILTCFPKKLHFFDICHIRLDCIRIKLYCTIATSPSNTKVFILQDRVNVYAFWHVHSKTPEPLHTPTFWYGNYHFAPFW